MKARLLLLAVLLAAVPATAGQVYSWTDANGTKHFSDSPPPPSVNAQKIKPRGAGVASEESAAPEPVATATAKADTPATPGSTAAKPLVDSPENRAKQCQMARSNLALLQSNFQVSAPAGDDGKAAVLDEAGRRQAVERAADQVAFYCK
jgi:hypothetical protein